jgi:hypothetical protein
MSVNMNINPLNGSTFDRQLGDALPEMVEFDLGQYDPIADALCFWAGGQGIVSESNVVRYGFDGAMLTLVCIEDEPGIHPTELLGTGEGNFNVAWMPVPQITPGLTSDEATEAAARLKTVSDAASWGNRLGGQYRRAEFEAEATEVGTDKDGNPIMRSSSLALCGGNLDGEPIWVVFRVEGRSWVPVMQALRPTGDDKSLSMLTGVQNAARRWVRVESRDGGGQLATKSGFLLVMREVDGQTSTGRDRIVVTATVQVSEQAGRDHLMVIDRLMREERSRLAGLANVPDEAQDFSIG